MPQQGAQEILADTLASYGLESLASWAWNLYTTSGIENWSDFQPMLKTELVKQPAFKARFPVYEQLQKEGRGISIDAYAEYERSVKNMLSLYKIPPGMYDDPDAIGKLLTNGIAPTEVNKRLQMAAVAAIQAPQEVRDSLRDMYGVDMGGLTAYYLDPDRAQPLLEKQWAAAQVAGAAERQKIAVDTATAERLAAQGVSYEQAQRGFGEVAASEGLQAGPGETVTQGELVGAAFGDAASAVKRQRVAASRQAGFSGGGQAAESQQGVVGLRQSSSR